MEKKKILIIALIVALLFFTNFTPISKIVSADDTVDIIFQITGNMTIEVSPASKNFSTIYANSSESTETNEFTIWNNGTVDNLTIDAMITNDVIGDLNCSEDGDLSIANSYALKGLTGTVDSTPWYNDTGYNVVDNDLVKGVQEYFGLTLYVGNITVQNTQWETLTITYRANA
jgi:hypothetical protein